MLYSTNINKEIKDYIERVEANSQLITEIDSKVKEKGELLHRFIYEPYADGNAVYQIIRVNKKTARIKVCKEIGDDWVVPYWGEESTIPLHYAEMSVARRDTLDKLFRARD